MCLTSTRLAQGLRKKLYEYGYASGLSHQYCFIRSSLVKLSKSTTNILNEDFGAVTDHFAVWKWPLAKLLTEITSTQLKVEFDKSKRDTQIVLGVLMALFPNTAQLPCRKLS